MKKFDLTFFVIAVCLIFVLDLQLASNSGSVFLSKNLSADVSTAVQPTITIASPASEQSISNTAPTTITWSSTGLDSSATVNIFARTLTTGDANADGSVGFSDYVVLSNHFGQKVTNGGLSGDFNGDGAVDFADEVIQSNHNGQSSDIALVSNVANNGSAQVNLSSVPLGQTMIGVKTADGSVKALSGVVNITNVAAPTTASASVSASVSAPAPAPSASLDASVFSQTSTSPTLSGTATNLTAGIVVVLRSGSQTGPVVWYGFPSVTNGTWSKTVTPALAPGSYYVSVATNDTNINLYQGGPINVGVAVSNATPTSTPAPSTPVVVTTSQVSATLDASLLNQTFASTPTIFGTASGASGLIIAVNSASDGNLVYRNLFVPVINGTWSISLNRVLNNGSYNVSLYDTKSNLIYKGGPVKIFNRQNVDQSLILQWNIVPGAVAYAVYLNYSLVATTTNVYYLQPANSLLPSRTYNYVFVPLFNTSNATNPARFINPTTFQPISVPNNLPQNFISSIFESIYNSARGTLLAVVGYTPQSAPKAQTQTVTTAAPFRSSGVTFSADPTSVPPGGTSKLSWNSPKGWHCFLDSYPPPGNGRINLSGGEGAGNKTVTINQDQTFSLNCGKDYASGGDAEPQANKVTVTIQKLSITFSADPGQIQSGAKSTLTWSTTPKAGEGECLIVAPDPESPSTLQTIAMVGGSGTTQVSPKTTTTYTIDCSTGSGDSLLRNTADATVMVGSQAQKVETAAVPNQPGQIAVSWQKVQPLPGATVVYLVGTCPYPATTPEAKGFCHTITQTNDTTYTHTNAGSISYGLSGLTGYRYSVTAENTYPNSNPGLYIPIPVTGNDSSDPGYPNASFSKVLPLPNK